MRVLTSPAETGAVTLSFPQDVQAEAFDCPEEFLAERTWHVPRQAPDPAALAAAVDAIRAARRPLGSRPAAASSTPKRRKQLRAFCEATGIPVAETQAGKGSLPYDHASNLGAVGATGTFAANRFAAAADLVIGIGTRYSDFTTASKTAVPGSVGSLRERQRRGARHCEARRPFASPRTRASTLRAAHDGLARSRGRRRATAPRRRSSTGSGTPRSAACTRSGANRCLPRAR